MPRCKICNLHCSDSLNAKRHCDTKEKARANITLARSKKPRALITRRINALREAN